MVPRAGLAPAACSLGGSRAILLYHRGGIRKKEKSIALRLAGIWQGKTYRAGMLSIEPAFPYHNCTHACGLILHFNRLLTG